ncbi:MAG: sialate O-acetylesterase, partial [Planctomycetes bacterium]|nr:sialate O-acetylesterase [Planctomycetota bacterium]
MKRILTLLLGLILGLSAWSANKKSVKVFILAGQSNMEGRGFPEPLAWQVSQEKYRERYTHFIK